MLETDAKTAEIYISTHVNKDFINFELFPNLREDFDNFASMIGYIRSLKEIREKREIPSSRKRFFLSKTGINYLKGIYNLKKGKLPEPNFATAFIIGEGIQGTKYEALIWQEYMYSFVADTSGVEFASTTIPRGKEFLDNIRNSA